MNSQQREQPPKIQSPTKCHGKPTSIPTVNQPKSTKPSVTTIS